MKDNIKRMIKKIPIISILLNKRHIKCWKNKNKNNYTNMGKYMYDIERVNVGKGTYGTLNVIHFDNNSKSVLSIGNYCSIAPDVIFLLDGEHCYNTISTYPFKSKILNQSELLCTKGDIVIEDDVWIGFGCTILSGVKIGKGAVIGARTVVAKDVPPYSIFINGKVIKYRFNNDIINSLSDFDYSKIDEQFIKNNIDILSSELDIDIVKTIIERQNDYEKR